jgi:UV DNA damage endonuclease
VESISSIKHYYLFYGLYNMTDNFRLGYACINNELAVSGVQVNRSMMKRTFLSKGIDYVSALTLMNVSDLSKIVDWNLSHDISFYRMSSDMFPWMSEYELSDLPDIKDIRATLKSIGENVARHNHRLTFHPGPFNVLASPYESVITKTLKELRQHGEIMDMLGLPRSHFAKINIHIGGAYGDKPAALSRFIGNVKHLDSTAISRLTIENDDKANLFSVKINAGVQ